MRRDARNSFSYSAQRCFSYFHKLLRRPRDAVSSVRRDSAPPKKESTPASLFGGRLVEDSLEQFPYADHVGHQLRHFRGVLRVLFAVFLH